MKRASRLICLLLAASVCPWVQAEEQPAPVGEQPKLDAQTDAVLQKMEAQARKTESISCDFPLTHWSELFEEKSVKSGKLYYKKPERVRIDREKPDEKQYFINEKRWYEYDPEARYVRYGQRGKEKEEEVGLFALDLWKSPEKLRREFTVRLRLTEKKDKQTLHLLEVTPKDKKTKTEYTEALFWVDEKLSLPVRIKCFEKSEDTVTYEFSKIKLNPRLSDGMFRFKITRDMIAVNVDEEAGKD